MPLIHANNTQLWVERFGDPSLPPVLLLHGLFFSGAMYAAQLPLLTPHFHCVTIDWRSMGRSPLALGGHDVDNMCADVLAVQDALQLGPVHWVGSSVGGVAGIRVAAQWPQRLLSLVTCGASAHAEPVEKLTRYESLLASYARDTAAAWPLLAPVLYGSVFLNDPARAAAVQAEREAFVNNDGPAIQRAAAPILRRVGRGSAASEPRELPTGSGVLRVGDLVVDTNRRQVTRDGQRIALTYTEFSLLELLFREPGRVVPRAEILEQLWGYPPRRAADLRVVDVYVARLRGKLEPDPRNPELILTVRGTGYASQRMGDGTLAAAG